MKKLFKGFFTVLSLLFVVFLSEKKVTAAELKNTDIIDAIEFSDMTLAQGQLTSIKVDFSKKAGMTIVPGDTITLELPPELQGLTESNGAPRSIALSNLGEALVYQDKIIVTFNENVRHLDQIKGHFTFGVRTTLTNVSEDTQIETNLGTTIATQTLTIQGQPPQPDVEEQTYPFFYKSGDLLGDSGQVRWFLNVNLNKEQVASDIEIADQLGAGQTLNLNSFYITIASKTASHSVNATEFVNQGYGTIELLSDTKFTLRFFKEKADVTSFTVMYTATITEAGKKQATFDNSYQLNYQLPNKETTLENNSVQVKNIFTDGDADGTLTPQLPQEQELEDLDETTEPLDTQNPETIVPDYVEQPDEINEKPLVTIPETLVDDSLISENDETTESFDTQNPEMVVPDYVEVPNEINEKPIVSIPETFVDQPQQREKQTRNNNLAITDKTPNVANQQTPWTQQTATTTCNKETLNKPAFPKTGWKQSKQSLLIGFLLSVLAFISLYYQVKVKSER